MSMTMRMDRGMRNASSSALNASTNSTSSLASASSPPRRSKSVSHVPAASSPSTISSSSNGRRSVGSVNAKHSSGSGRVRVAARLRPRNAEEIIADADFPDCVELQPELKRLRLRKNNWESETFQFDEVFTETASQKRVYEVVAKPVVESVLNGYNGTVMAYGQTGTGKTFTLGQLGEKDSAQRGIMVRALEDILADINPDYDSVTVSYLQLYLESVQDLLAPGKDNIPIVEDPKSGDVSLPGATMVQVHDHKSFVQLLKTGEVNRYATNTKMNTESSRSHAILLVYVKRSVTEKKENERPGHHENGSQSSKANRLPMVRKSKLLLVDLAGSERVNKAGSEGHTLDEAKAINLSLTALGKCINALAENSPHIPIRDSKLTRLLRDSFGGSARTSLVITIGPSPRHRGETASTIMFGQRAMKVENMVKLKEEFDYKSLCRKLENQLDTLTIENERQSKFANDAKQEMERKLKETQLNLIEAEKKLALGSEALIKEKSKMQDEIGKLERKLEQGHAHHEMMTKMIDNFKTISKEKEKEFLLEHQKHQDELHSLSLSYQSELEDLNKQLEAESIRKERLEKELHLIKQELKKKSEEVGEMEVEKMQQQEQIIDLRQRYQQEICEITQKLNAEHAQSQHAQEQMKVLEQNISASHKRNETRDQSEILGLRKKLDDQTRYQESLEKELHVLQVEREENTVLKEKLHEELQSTIHKLKEEQRQRSLLEEELITLKQQIAQLTSEVNENKKILEKENSGKFSVGSECHTNIMRSTHVRDTINGQRATIAKLFEEVGLPKILSLLESEDVDVRIHAVKVVANLAAEEVNQEKIVEAGGLTSLLMLLETSEDETIQRVAAGAIANLAMNEKNQELIMKQGGIMLLAKIANKAEDPQTLRMVAGAIANLCGNDKLQLKLRDEGGIKALLGMVRSRHQDVLAQVARGVANFAKCESRGAIQGHRNGRSLLIDDGALPWIVTNSNSEATPIRRHIELALCHLAQHEANARDLVACGALWELVRISRECSREDIRNLARRTLNTSSTFQNELKRMHSPYD